MERFVIDRNPAVYNVLNDLVSRMADEGRAREALDLTLDISKKVSTPVTFTDQFFYHLALSSCYVNLDQLDLAKMHVAAMDSMETKAESIEARKEGRRSTISMALYILNKASIARPGKILKSIS